MLSDCKNPNLRFQVEKIVIFLFPEKSLHSLIK